MKRSLLICSLEKKGLSLLLLSCLFLIPLVSSLGITPPGYNEEFISGETLTFTFSVLENSGRDTSIQITYKGDFQEYVTLSKEEFSLEAGGREDLTLTIDLPKEAEKPGKNVLRIYAQEVKEGGGIMATVGVIGKMTIFVPYPGRYAEISTFQVAEGKGGVNEGEDTPVHFVIKSRGEQPLLATNASLLLYDIEGQLLDTITFPTINIFPDGTFDQTVLLDTSTLPPSDYMAVLLYTYDDTTRKVERTFKVGDFDINLLSYTNELEQKGIVPITLTVENSWKGGILTSAHVTIGTETTEQTAKKSIVDFSTAELKAYIDTSSLTLGNHTGTAVVTYEKQTPLEIDTPQTKTFPLAITLKEPQQEEVEETKKRLVSSNILIITLILGILFVVAIVFLILLLKGDHHDKNTHKKDKQKK